MNIQFCYRGSGFPYGAIRTLITYILIKLYLHRLKNTVLVRRRLIALDRERVTEKACVQFAVVGALAVMSTRILRLIEMKPDHPENALIDATNSQARALLMYRIVSQPYHLLLRSTKMTFACTSVTFQATMLMQPIISL